jgi:hypothetical protein
MIGTRNIFPGPMHGQAKYKSLDNSFEMLSYQIDRYNEKTFFKIDIRKYYEISSDNLLISIDLPVDIQQSILHTIYLSKEHNHTITDDTFSSFMKPHSNFMNPKIINSTIIGNMSDLRSEVVLAKLCSD